MDVFDTIAGIINSRITRSIFIIALASLCWLLLTRLYYRELNKNLKNKDRNGGSASTTAQHIAFSVIRGVIIFLCVIWLMEINGINVTATVTGLGLVSVVLGLALQDTIKDIFRGISLMTDKFYVVGDVVNYNGMCCEVIAMTLRSTKMRDLDTGSIITIFNGNIDNVTKMTGVQFLDIPLSYKDDYKYINQVMQEITNEIAKIDGIIFASYKGTQSFEESAILYRIKITTRQLDRYDLRRAALRKVQEGLDKAGLEIPFNQLDVHMDN